MKGYVQVYTGNGKGKTTAAFGLALRAAGAGLKVFIAQFVKGQEYSELCALKRFDDLIELRQYGTGCFIFAKPENDDIQAARKGFEEVKHAIVSRNYDVVILDEANIATHYKLIAVEDLLELIRIRPAHVELVITGRYADEKIIDKADLVTEMREVKHYYTQGVDARAGIEK